MNQIYTEVTPELFLAVRKICVKKQIKNLGSLASVKKYIGFTLEGKFIETADIVDHEVTPYKKINVLEFVSRIINVCIHILGERCLAAICYNFYHVFCA
jgi:hypothetical protein